MSTLSGVRKPRDHTQRRNKEKKKTMACCAVGQSLGRGSARSKQVVDHDGGRNFSTGMAYEGDFLVVAPEITGDARGCAHAEVAGSADRERGRTFGDEPGDLFLTDRRTHVRAASLTRLLSCGIMPIWQRKIIYTS